MNTGQIRNRILASILFAVVVYAGLTAYGDFQEVAKSFGDFQWALLPVILLVTCGNYALRFLKWEYYLVQVGVRGLRRSDSFLIFFSGLGMVITPGKIGEWLKSYLLREVHGTPITRSAPILLAERLTDSLALMILAAVGVIFFGPEYWWVVTTIAIGSAIAIIVARHRPTALGLLGLLEKVPFIKRFSPRFLELYESTYILMDPRTVILMTLLSVGSWFFEVLAFYLTVIGLGVDASVDTLLKAAFILPIATLAAAIVVIAPGGLGVAEGLLTTLSISLFGLPRGPATVATVIIRIATLWFGVAVGLVSFGILTRRLARQGKHLDTSPEDAALAGDPAA